MTERRTKKDWAEFLQEMIDTHYQEAEHSILVMDNLNTHVLSSFSEAFDAPTARRLVEKVEIHSTPKHGSRVKYGRNRAVHPGSAVPLRPHAKQVRAWQTERNQAQVTINWRFTTQDARVKLKRLYPSLERKERYANYSNEK